MFYKDKQTKLSKVINHMINDSVPVTNKNIIRINFNFDNMLDEVLTTLES